MNKENLLGIPIWMPGIEKVKAMAEILSSLDDKIELNNQIDRDLEALSQTLFKQWFVDFEFPDENGVPYQSSGGEMVESELGDIPLGWRVGTVFDLFELQRGHDLPTSSRVAGDVPVFSASGFPGFHNEVKVLTLGITTGRSGVIGKVFLVLDDFWPLNTSLFVKKFKKATPYFTYFFLQSIDLQSLKWWFGSTYFK